MRNLPEDFENEKIEKKKLIKETVKHCKVLIQIYTNYKVDLIGQIFDINGYVEGPKNQYYAVVNRVWTYDDGLYLPNAIHNITNKLASEHRDLTFDMNDDREK